MESLIYTLIAAGISGLTFVAYKEPDFYEEKFANKIFCISIASLMLALTWGSALTLGFSKIKEFLAEGKVTQAEAVVKNLYIPETAEFVIWFVFFYSLFLMWLSDHRSRYLRNATL